MDVANQLQEVGVLLHEQCPIPSFEQMASAPKPPIYTPRITACNKSNKTAQGMRTHLHGHMDMDAHPTVGVDAVAISNDSFG